MAKRKAAKKKAAKKKTAKKKAARRELIDTRSSKRYVRRASRGRFNEVEDVGRSSAQDRRRRAAKKAKRGQGDRGDR